MEDIGVLVNYHIFVAVRILRGKLELCSRLHQPLNNAVMTSTLGQHQGRLTSVCPCIDLDLGAF